MHVCFVTYGKRFRRNPGYFRAVGLGTALIKRGVRVTYLVDDYPENRSELELDQDANVAYTPRSGALRPLLARRRVLHELRPDYVNLLNPTLRNCLTVAGQTPYKIIADWDEPPTFKKTGVTRRLMDRALDRWMRKRTDHAIVATGELKELFECQHGQHALYLPHATYLQPLAETTTPFPERTAVYMGQFKPIWDHDMLFEAARLLAADGYRPRIQIIGDGTDRPKFQRFVETHGLYNVELAGFLRGDELWRRLRHAHVSLFPIRDTPLNRTRCPSKTFAYGQARRPIITSRVGEVPAILGEAATYVDCTPRAYADAIRAAMDRELPDVDYQIENHTYDIRAARLLHELEAA